MQPGGPIAYINYYCAANEVYRWAVAILSHVDAHVRCAAPRRAFSLFIASIYALRRKSLALLSKLTPRVTPVIADREQSSPITVDDYRFALSSESLQPESALRSFACGLTTLIYNKPHSALSWDNNQNINFRIIIQCRICILQRVT